MAASFLRTMLPYVPFLLSPFPWRPPFPTSHANKPQTFQNCITQDTASSVVLNANTYGAFVSWAFNVGCGNSGSSSLISRLNDGDDPLVVAEEELPKWKFSGGVELPGLVRRRAAEVELAQTDTDDGALPACS